MVKVAAQFVYIRVKGFSKEKEVFGFTHTETKNHLKEHMLKPWCMPGEQKELANQCVELKVFPHCYVFLMSQVKSSLITCTLYWQVNF